MCHVAQFRKYEFKLGHKTMEATKNICGVKGKGAVDHSNQMIQEILLVTKEP